MKNFIRYFIPIVFLLAWVFVYRVFFSDDIFTNTGVFPNRTVTIPDEYLRVSERLNSSDNTTTLLNLPTSFIGMNVFWWNNGQNGFAATNPFLYLQSGYKVRYLEYGLSESLRKAVDERKSICNILASENIDRIVLHKDAAWPVLDKNEYFFPNTKESFDLVVKNIMVDSDIIEDNSYFTLVSCKQPVTPVIYGLSGKDSEQTIRIDFNRIDPVKYTAKLDLKEGTDRHLVFLQTFHQGWKVFVGEGKARIQLDEANHSIYRDHFNIWLVESKTICQRIDCDKTVSVSIEFQPQDYFKVGLAISTLALLTSLFLIFILR